MPQGTHTEKNWLTENLVAFTRISCILAIIGILARRFYLAGTLGLLHLPPILVRILGPVEDLVELAALIGTPICFWLWFRLVRLGYLRHPSAWDYALVVLLYVVAFGYLPPPHGHDALHFGSYR